MATTPNPPPQSPSPNPQPSPATLLASSLNDTKPHLLLAATGSVATIKLPLIISSLSALNPTLSIRLILSKSATTFLAGQSPEQPPLSSLLALPTVAAIYTDADEWAPPWTRDAKILHIELRRWAHVLVIAPLSANALAKVTAGMCDDLLTSVVRAWDVRGGRKIVAAPAMNEMMWRHPVTARQVRVLREEWEWWEVLMPQVKELACGDVGEGGMCDWREVVRVVGERLEGSRCLVQGD
ncbi:MAG: hypothetical protein LQ338_007089 [Usnochroma carphineum]|nr:MAG: hypothetical protein LQ338_007089 [Usnochroma carphineum]